MFVMCSKMNLWILRTLLIFHKDKEEIIICIKKFLKDIICVLEANPIKIKVVNRRTMLDI